MPGKLFPVIIFSFFTTFSYAQEIPVIKAKSRTVTIRDGLHLKKDFWYILPERRPDYYYVEIPAKKHKVSFITDIDSISFNTEYGKEYNFIILLNDKDSCHTRVVAGYKKIISFKSIHPSDTLPFTIGSNSKIYFKGRINNSGPLNIQFDLGSGGSQIKKSSVKKVNMNFDGSVTLMNSDGTNVVPYSTSNTLEIAGLRWNSIPFAVSDNMTFREDLIAGNSLFQNKMVEINYDKKIVVIHDSLDMTDQGYSFHDMILDGGTVPFIKGSLTINSKTKEGWFLFDTGAYTTILRTNEIPAANKMLFEAKKMLGINSKKASPAIAFGNYSFSGINYTISKQDKDNLQLGLLGNDLLKRFNVILDNRNGYLYLKPNSLANEAYANPEYYVVRVITLIIILVIASVIFNIRRKKKEERHQGVSLADPFIVLQTGSPSPQCPFVIVGYKYPLVKMRQEQKSY